MFIYYFLIYINSIKFNIFFKIFTNNGFDFYYNIIDKYTEILKFINYKWRKLKKGMLVISIKYYDIL